MQSYARIFTIYKYSFKPVQYHKYAHTYIANTNSYYTIQTVKLSQKCFILFQAVYDHG